MAQVGKGFLSFSLENGLLHDDDDGNYKTKIFGFTPDNTLDLPAKHTHFGVVVSGEIELTYPERRRFLQAGDFFSVNGASTVTSITGKGMVTSAYGYHGLNIFGGEIEKKGRLRYIDGCTDTLLVPPVRKGEPCFNHLHFPKKIIQTPHTHPSIRTGVVYRGEGECVTPGVDAPVRLNTGSAFLIKTNTVHSFNTAFSEMDIIAFHPDSDTGVTDDDHPMVNRTMIDGVSANSIHNIRTLESK